MNTKTKHRTHNQIACDLAANACAFWREETNVDQFMNRATELWREAYMAECQKDVASLLQLLFVPGVH